MLAFDFGIPGTDWVVNGYNFMFGASEGMQIAMFAIALVLMYRVTGVLNFANMAMGTFAAGVMAQLAIAYDIPYWISLAVGLVTGAVVGLVIETLLIRRIFKASRLVMLIATLGISQLLILATDKLPDYPLERGAWPFPQPKVFEWSVSFMDPVKLQSYDVYLLTVGPAAIVGLWMLLNRTRLGHMLQATTDNPDTARLFGMSPKRASTITWVLCGTLAGLAMILTVPARQIIPSQIAYSGSGTTVLLMQTFTVCVAGKFRSFGRVVGSAIGIGVITSIIRSNVDTNSDGVILALLLVVLLVILLPRRWGFATIARSETKWSLVSPVAEVPAHLQKIWWIRRLPSMGYGVMFLALILLPSLVSITSTMYATQVIGIAIAAMSLSLLTGWAGLISLGQFAFAGIGGLSTIAFVRGHEIPIIGASLHLNWVFALILGALVTAAFAALVGLPALRVQGLMLSIVSVAFAAAAASFIFEANFFTDGEGTTRALRVPQYARQMRVLGVDLNANKSFYFVTLVILAICMMTVIHLRKTAVGRNIIAVRENEDMAATATVSPTRAKMLAFATAGAIAGIGGGIFATSLAAVTPSQTFNIETSIKLLSTAVIGGLGTAGGPLLGAMFTEYLPYASGSSDGIVPLLTSSIGLLILVMYFPGGFMQIFQKMRGAIVDWAGKKYPAPPRAAASALTRVLPALPPVDVDTSKPLLVATDVRVTFGGVNAVAGATITVGQNEIVGLIGANGAGKSTLMNAISGLVRTSGGTVNLMGNEIAHLSPYKRHGRTMARGYQAARLYPELTVRETILVALEAREKTPYLPALFNVPPYRGIEKRHRSTAQEVIDFLGLGRYADQNASNLSTGTRRIVEFGCLIAMSPKLILLDEPTGGVAQKETEAFGPLIKRISRELGASVLIIEHDMPLVMSISDRMYCLETGLVIAEGTPQDVRNNPRVVASYLGTDERAIQRSNS